MSCFWTDLKDCTQECAIESIILATPTQVDGPALRNFGGTFAVVDDVPFSPPVNVTLVEVYAINQGQDCTLAGFIPPNPSPATADELRAMMPTYAHALYTGSSLPTSIGSYHGGPSTSLLVDMDDLVSAVAAPDRDAIYLSLVYMEFTVPNGNHWHSATLLQGCY